MPTPDQPATPAARPLDGVRILALEQMQALPFATQLMGRLGADVIKVEARGRGDSGRLASPYLTTPEGERFGATFLRYNLGKRSLAMDLKSERGRDLVRRLAQRCDVVCENLGPGRAQAYGLDYETLGAGQPGLVYLSVSGFGTLDPSPYQAWPAYAVVAEAMSGIYGYAQQPGQPPIAAPMGGIGDTAAGLFGVVGVLAALRQRDRTGIGQFVDIAMYDAMVAMGDITYNYWSMGLRRDPDQPRRVPVILDGFRCDDGWVMLQVVREHQFARLAEIVGHSEWLTDPRFADRFGWADHLDSVIRPAIEAWAGGRTKHETAALLAAAGIAAAPANTPEDLVRDEHLAARRMLVEIPRTDGVAQPVLVAGNPVKLSGLVERDETYPPRLGEHTAQVLTELLDLSPDELADLARSGVVDPL